MGGQLARGQNYHFASLDGLRGIAALVVLLGHATAVALGPRLTLVPRKLLAVEFFFMLSGFVVAYAYEDRFRAGFSVREFLLRRAVRLYPMIVVGAVIGTVRCAVAVPEFWHAGSWLAAPACALMNIPLIDRSVFSGFEIDPPQWSLFYELLAYVGFALFVPRTPTAVLAAAAAAGYAIFAMIDARLPDLSFRRAVLFCAPAAMASYLTGVLLWRLFRLGRIPDLRIPLPVLGLPIVIACMIPYRFGIGVDLVAVLVVFPAVLLGGAAGGRHPSGRLTIWLGDVSFPLYIVHFPILLALADALGPHLRARYLIGASMIVSVAVAVTFTVLYDKPIRTWMVRALRTRTILTREKATVSA